MSNASHKDSEMHQQNSLFSTPFFGRKNAHNFYFVGTARLLYTGLLSPSKGSQ
jgi:hypothetical protein